MERRAFLAALSTMLAARRASAQPVVKTARAGVLWPGPSVPPPPRMESFRQGLHDAGYAEGRNVAIDLRFSDQGDRRLHDLAAELVQLGVLVIVAFGDQAPRAAQGVTTTIPIVAIADDILGSGLVASLGHPGGNTTGVTILSPELSAKRLAVLKEILPSVSRVATLWDPATGTSQIKTTDTAARLLKVKLQVLEVRTGSDLVGAFDAAKKGRAEAINVCSSPLLASLYREIVDLTAAAHLPAIYQWREHAEAGGLASYGPSLGAMWRQTGVMAGKILSGMPASLLARADHVIE